MLTAKAVYLIMGGLRHGPANVEHKNEHRTLTLALIATGCTNSNRYNQGYDLDEDTGNRFSQQR